MFTAYVVVVALAAAANTFSATCDFLRYPQVAAGMAKTGVPESWMTTLGALKLAGAVGLVVGIAVPLIGTAAGIGLVLFFVCAIGVHLRVRDYSFQLGLATAFLLSASAALALTLAYREAA